MNIKVKAIALLLASTAALSFTGCSQTLKSSANGYDRSIKVTGGDKLYDNYGIIDGFQNGCATGSWIKWNGTQYYSAETTNARTIKPLKFTCRPYPQSLSPQGARAFRQMGSPSKSV